MGRTTALNLRLRIATARPVLLSAVYPDGKTLSWVGGEIRSWDAALIEVTFDDGTTGVGEVGAGIMAALAVPGIIDALRPYLEGCTFESPLEIGDHLRSHTAFWARGGILSGAIGAIELAAIDGVGKREGVPAYDVLGGRRRDSIEAYASGGLGTSFDQVSDWANAQAAEGYRTVKFRAMRDPETTIALVQHVVPKLPSGVRFILDAVQACAARPWGVDDAIRVGHVVARYGGRWFEEPCQADDVGGYAAVRLAVETPVSGVESNGTVREFQQLVENKALDILQPDVTFVGGAAAFARVSKLASDGGLACVPHVWGSGVTLMANMHVSFADPHVQLFESCTLPNPLRDALLVEPLRLAEGHLAAPTAPGFGVRLTRELEQRYQFEEGGGHVIRSRD